MTSHRKLGPVLATIVVAGNMIGSGIFLLPATLASVGSVTLIGWVIASLGALALALLFGKLARRKPMAGGPATYAFDAFGPFVGHAGEPLVLGLVPDRQRRHRDGGGGLSRRVLRPRRRARDDARSSPSRCCGW